MTGGWHLVTGEYARGGIGDYSALLARALADAGETVHVWTTDVVDGPAEERLTLHHVPAWNGDGFRAIDRALRAEPVPRRLLVQYAPQAFGARGMNLGFSRWVSSRARAGDEVRVTFHEPYYPFGWRHPRRNVLAVANRLMARTLLRAAARVYVSTPAWQPRLMRWAPSPPPPFAWLPIPSTIPRIDDPERVAALRERFAPGGAPLAVHFGTYGGGIAPLLADALRVLLRGAPELRVLLVGRGSARFAADVAGDPRVHATGMLSADEVSLHLQAADVAVQPYPDGASSRRTTLMACLANGVPTVTAAGAATEPVWREAPVALLPRTDAGAIAARAAALLADPGRRAALSAGAAGFHQRHFGMDVTLRTLRGP